MPSHNLLLQLHRFDRSSFEFHDQLCNILYGEAYQQCLSDLQSGDFVWLVDYLDEVRCRILFPRSLLKPSPDSRQSRSR